MNKYLIALDLDLTLLKTNKGISLKTRAFLKHLENKGCLIVFNSGRPLRGIKKFYKKCHLSSPIISNNGGKIIFPKNHEYDKEETIPIEIFKEIYSKLKDEYIDSLSIGNEEFGFCDKVDYFKFCIHDDGIFKNYIGKNFLDKCNINPLGGLIKLKNTEDLNGFCSKISLILKDNYTYRIWGHANDPYVDINNINASKSKGIKYIANIYNIKEENILVFGDAENDIDMLSSFKNSFAMKNAKDEAKKVAKYITKYDNNHNGVIKAIKQFLKENKNSD